MLTTFVQEHESRLQEIANTVRGLCMDTVLKSNSGHIGLPLGASEIMTLLYFGVMNHSPADHKWLDRDRFVLSAGHGSALQYALLHLSGYDLTIDDLKKFRQFGSKTPGHPEFGITTGIECTTGPLGQGFAMAVGMALAEARLASRFGEVLNHHTFALVGDGCLMEGISSEAASFAGHLGLSKLIVYYDDNQITIDGKTDITFSENIEARFRAMGWNVLSADGHNFKSLAQATEEAMQSASVAASKPTLIICRTIAGKGLLNWEGKPKVHGNPHNAADVAQAKNALKLPPDEFHVSQEIKTACATYMQARMSKYLGWHEKLNESKATWETTLQNEWEQRFNAAKEFHYSSEQLAEAKAAAATRQSSGLALKHAYECLKELMGGSADLAGSNNSTLSGSAFVQRGSFDGSNIHFGVREFAMGAIANGLALHGGIRPFCATFAVFSDYMRPAIRLAALMKIPTLFILTHDSYAVGEDGPTHQPIEHLAALRAMPGLAVYRPADGTETFAAWESALNEAHRPAAFLLTRQKVESLDDTLRELQLKPRDFETVLQGMHEGAYLLKDFDDGMANPTEQKSNLPETIPLIILASGSEVADALRAGYMLEQQTWKNVRGEARQIRVRVVSAPRFEALLQNSVRLEALVPRDYLCFGVEAGVTQSFAAAVGRSGFVFGIDHFGESAPAEVLKSHFGFSADALSRKMLSALGLR